MSETTAALLPILHMVTGGGAGIIAAYLISWLRTRYPVPASAPRSALARLGLAIIHAPRYTRYTAMILAALIAMPFAALAAYLQQQPVLPVIDALIAALISQVYHAATEKSGAVPYAALFWTVAVGARQEGEGNADTTPNAAPGA